LTRPAATPTVHETVGDLPWYAAAMAVIAMALVHRRAREE